MSIITSVGLALLLVGALTSVESRRSFRFHFDGIKCVKCSEIVTSLNCTLQEVNNITSIFMDFVLAENISSLTYDFMVTLRNTRQPMVLFNVTAQNGCEFLSGKFKYPLLQIIRKEFGRFSNIPSQCPLLEGNAYYVRGLNIDPENFPSYIPDTKFTTLNRMYNNKEPLIEIETSGSFETIARYYKGLG